MPYNQELRELHESPRNTHQDKRDFYRALSSMIKERKQRRKAA